MMEQKTFYTGTARVHIPPIDQKKGHFLLLLDAWFFFLRQAEDGMDDMVCCYQQALHDGCSLFQYNQKVKAEVAFMKQKSMINYKKVRQGSKNEVDPTGKHLNQNNRQKYVHSVVSNISHTTNLEAEQISSLSYSRIQLSLKNIYLFLIKLYMYFYNIRYSVNTECPR